MMIVNEYAHLQKHNRFHFSPFHLYYLIFISNKENKKRERDKEIKKMCFFVCFFELYFEHVRVLKCVFD